MRRAQTLALSSEAEKNIVIVVIFYEGERDDVMLVTVGRTVVICAKIEHPVHDGCMNANADLDLYGLSGIGKIQLGLWIIPWGERFLSHAQARHAG
ncbi:MAG: hypothetical protein AWM53_02100 [Candidatus Dichloromethanomonas elyunquensis]|nr:MAG: hypothetical protein AWM53_02100 [Candidatus Dichloromethanomonas elyunquensis]